MKKRLVFLAPLGILGMLLFVGLGGLVVQQLWNWLLPSMFGWPQVTFWQAVGILGLCRILVGGFGLHGSPRSHFRHRMGERWKDMVREDRDRLHSRIHERYGSGPPTGEGERS